MRSKAPISMVLLLLGAGALHAASDGFPPRRRAQFQTESGWVAVPYAFDVPGIGKGYGVLGAVANVAGSHADMFGTFFGGEVNGQAFGVGGVHLLPKRLILDVGGVHLSKTTLQSYSRRGMSTEKDDFSLVEFGDALFGGARLTATFLDRRFETYLGYYGGSSTLDSLRDHDGNLLLDATTSPKADVSTQILGTRLDLTDDYLDPRRGFQLEPSLWRSPPKGSGPNFFLVDTSLTAYVPVGRRNVLAMNYLRSDAHVLRKGETDAAALARDQGLDCAGLADADARRQCQDFVDTLAVENALGTATSLGGLNRLRSFPEGRYKDAHTEFVGAEFRWNLTDEVRPFNIYVMKDIRTTVQIAFFYEVGTVADAARDLWERSRSSYGTGFRMVTASGLVYRADLAWGQEGFAPTVFFQYPWQL